jgi:DNA-binding NarL/FixJ family response regulator
VSVARAAQAIGDPDVTKVVVVGDVRVCREALAQALSREQRIRVIGTFAARDGVHSHVAELAADVVLVDVPMPEGLRVVREVVQDAPDVRVVALGVPEDERDIIACAEAGVSGFVAQEGSLADVVSTIESVVRDEVLCTPKVAAALLKRVAALASSAAPEPVQARLTLRELEIVELLDRGLSNKEIAHALSISLPTVKNHVHSILEKLGVRRRAEAAARLRAGGFRRRARV